MPRLILQPEGSSLCGQCVVAMAAGVSLSRAITAVGHKNGTYTKDVRNALRSLGLTVDDRAKRISRIRPALPQRALLSIRQDRDKTLSRDRRLHHWMLTWDGRIYDPGSYWPDKYEGWRITSALEIHP